MDSFEILQHDNLHSWGDAHLFGFWKSWKLAILRPFFFIFSDCFELRICVFRVVSRTWLLGFIWYFTAWSYPSQGWLLLFIPHWVSTHMGNLKTAHVRASVRPSVRASVPCHISEMPGWIHLIFYSWITYIPVVMHVFSEFEKVENWRFYGSFSSFFLSDLDLGSVWSDFILWNGWMDSFDILQLDNLYSWDDAHLFRIWKSWKLAILWTFFFFFCPFWT